MLPFLSEFELGDFTVIDVAMFSFCSKDSREDADCLSFSLVKLSTSFNSLSFANLRFSTSCNNFSSYLLVPSHLILTSLKSTQ